MVVSMGCESVEVVMRKETYVLDGEVGDTDGADLALGELSHG